MKVVMYDEAPDFEKSERVRKKISNKNAVELNRVFNDIRKSKTK